ncbi:MAG: DUF4430 domain-containing protein [Clostridiales bacterium]|jgi:hypothetical protein|nr:DUF4430 domain-containing protein [Clostridiales bacterium]
MKIDSKKLLILFAVILTLAFAAALTACEPVEPKYEIPDLSAVTYDGEKTLADIALPDGWTWSAPETVLTAAVNEYPAVFTPQDIKKYKTVTVNVPLTVNKADYNGITHAYLSADDGEYTLADFELDEHFSWGDGAEVPDSGNGFYRAKYNADPANYNDYELLVNVKLFDGEVVFAAEAFSIGAGYIIAPGVYKIASGETAAEVFLRALEQNGLGYIGSAAQIKAVTGVNLAGYDNADFVKSKLHSDILAAFEDWEIEILGLGDIDVLSDSEICYDPLFGLYYSGWMYTVDGKLPGVGMNEKALLGGETFRFQYTVTWGDDIGCGFKMFSDYLEYEQVDRDGYTYYLAYINFNGYAEALGEAYAAAVEAISTIGITESELNGVFETLIAAEAELMEGEEISASLFGGAAQNKFWFIECVNYEH